MISTGLDSLPSKRSRSKFEAIWAGESLGSTRSSTCPKEIFEESENSEARNRSDTNSTGSGLRMVKRASFSQPPFSLGARSRLMMRRLLTLSPIKFRSAGTASAAPITAIITTVKPARAKDCRKYCGKNAIESITTATVRPEKSTVLPADATVLVTDSATELPAARSSRKRFTIRRL